MIKQKHLPDSAYFREINTPQPFLTAECAHLIDQHRYIPEYLETNPAFFGRHTDRPMCEPWRPRLFPLLAASPVLELCHKKLGFREAMIFSMHPNSITPSHIDPDRMCSINMLIEGWDSKTLFYNSVYFNEITYKPHTLFLYNTSLPHSVLNFNNSRYLITVSFKDMRPFEEVADFLNSHGLLVDL